MPFLWAQPLRKALREFIQIWQKCNLDAFMAWREFTGLRSKFTQTSHSFSCYQHGISLNTGKFSTESDSKPEDKLTAVWWSEVYNCRHISDINTLIMTYLWLQGSCDAYPSWTAPIWIVFSQTQSSTGPASFKERVVWTFAPVLRCQKQEAAARWQTMADVVWVWEVL